MVDQVLTHQRNIIYQDRQRKQRSNQIQYMSIYQFNPQLGHNGHKQLSNCWQFNASNNLMATTGTLLSLKKLLHQYRPDRHQRLQLLKMPWSRWSGGPERSGRFTDSSWLTDIHCFIMFHPCLSRYSQVLNCFQGSKPNPAISGGTEVSCIIATASSISIIWRIGCPCREKTLPLWLISYEY